MRQFVVPQFIDVEDKILGPITVRQFLILLVTGLILFIMFKLFDFALFVVSGFFIGGFALVVAFVKINGQAFHYVLLNVGQTMRQPALRIWDKRYTKQELADFRKPFKPEEVEVVPVKAASPRHIRDLSLLVNTGGYYNPKSSMKDEVPDRPRVKIT